MHKIGIVYLFFASLKMILCGNKYRRYRAVCFRLWEHTYFFYGGKHGTVPILRKGICGQLLSAMRRTQTKTKRLSSVQRGAVAANQILPPMRVRISRPQTERGGKNALAVCTGKAAKGNQNSARDHLSRLRRVLRLRKFSARRTARKFNLFGQARVCRVHIAEIGIAPLCADRDQSANLSSLRCIKRNYFTRRDRIHRRKRVRRLPRLNGGGFAPKFARARAGSVCPMRKFDRGYHIPQNRNDRRIRL